MKSFTINIFEVVNKLAADTGVDLDTLEYVLHRVKHEGVPFLTVTLPKLSKAVIRGLEEGFFDRTTLSTFSWHNKSLRFFRSFLDGIFDHETGLLLDDYDYYCVANLRQFCEYFYKTSFSFTPCQLKEAEQKYTDVEESLSRQSYDLCWVDHVRKNLHTHYKAYMDTDINTVFSKYRPRVGPGSFFGSKDLREPYYVHKQLPSKVTGLTSKIFNAMSGYFKAYPSAEEMLHLVSEETMSSVVFVPKDSRGPRVISQEPYHSLRAQLAHLDWAMDTLQDITNGRIQFKDQSISRKLALEGSVTRRWSTLDLKDASDRVSYKLVRMLFEHAKAPLWFVKHTRSTHTCLPSGKILRLNKLSGMGSGLTFPIMALVIHASICTSIAMRTSLSYNYIMKRVYVYGDDVIVPTCWYDFARSGLSRSGLLVNSDKSFFRGFFRESCGGDYIKGVDVTPVKLKLQGAGLHGTATYRSCSVRIDTDAGLLQVDRHARELNKKLLVNTARYYENLCSYSLNGIYPDVTGESAALGRYKPDSLLPENVQVKAVFPSAHHEHVGAIRCPYKFLGQFLADCSREDIKRISSYDLLAASRSVKLKTRLVTGVSMH